MKLPFAAIFLPLLLAFCASAVADGASSSFLSPAKPWKTPPLNPFRPLAISANGEWAFYGNGTHNLYRVSTKNPGQRQTISLPASPTLISVSRSGQKVLFRTSHRGFGLLDFSIQTYNLTWINEPHGQYATSAGNTYKVEYYPAAISPDGEMYASFDSPWDAVTVFSTKDQSPLFSFPLAEIKKSSSLLHLEFLPGNQFLLVVETAPTNDHSGVANWRTIFSLWDINTKQLHNSAEVASAYRPFPDALVGFGHFSGDGWAIQQTERDQAAEVVRFPLRDCALSPEIPKKLTVQEKPQLTSELKWATDSFGRWIAVSKPPKNLPGSADKYAIEFLDVSRVSPALGKPLFRINSSGQVNQMRASLDGTALWATLEDGRLERWDVPREALNLPAKRSQIPPSYCPSADESPKARTGNLSPAYQARQAIHVAATKTDFPDNCPPSFFHPKLQAADGRLVRDVGTELIFYNPSSGQEVERLSTPRKYGICTTTLEESEAFLTYQGDTVAIRTWNGSRRILDTRPGFKVALVLVDWERYQSIVFVNWALKAASARGQAVGVSAAYSLKTGKLIKDTPAIQCNDGFKSEYPVVSCDRPVVQLTDEDLKMHGAKTEYIADIGSYGSLSVRHMQDSSEPSSIIFRHGMNGFAPISSADDEQEAGDGAKKSKKAGRRISPYYQHEILINDHLVLGIKGASSDLFNFRTRDLIATFPISIDYYFGVRPAWDSKTKTLWVLENDGLHGWQLEESSPK